MNPASRTDVSAILNLKKRYLKNTQPPKTMNESLPKRGPAFTLIELLVVIAIM